MCARRPHDRRQLRTEAFRRTRGVIGKIQEMAKVAHQHTTKVATRPPRRPVRGDVDSRGASMSTLLNTLTIAGQTMLLTRTNSGTAIHLTTTDASADARAAIRDRPDEPRGAATDELLDRRWSPNSLCGRTWAAVADGYDDHAGQRGDRPEAPTCRSCLTVLDKSFPTPTRDDRIPVLADLVATAVNEHGTAEIDGVPGDQMNALRHAIPRRATATFSGFSTRTITQDGLLVISSPETRHLIEQTAARAIADFDFGATTKIDDTGWRFHWTTWSVS